VRRAGITGLVLTGGNDLAMLGGDAPERDAVENAMLNLAERRGLPILVLEDIPPTGSQQQYRNPDPAI